MAFSSAFHAVGKFHSLLVLSAPFYSPSWVLSHFIFVAGNCCRLIELFYQKVPSVIEIPSHFWNVIFYCLPFLFYIPTLNVPRSVFWIWKPFYFLSITCHYLFTVHMTVKWLNLEIVRLLSRVSVVDSNIDSFTIFHYSFLFGTRNQSRGLSQKIIDQD